MQANNSILSYECCFIFHFVLEPSREKHFCLSHGTECGGQSESVRWLIFHSNGNSRSQIVGHYPKESILPGCFTILHFRRWITWFLSLLFFCFLEKFSTNTLFCQDSGAIFNSLFFTWSVWYFPKELKFLRRCSKTHL